MTAKIPPPVVLLICGAVMWLIAKFLPQLGFVLPYSVILFWFFLLVGFYLLVRGVVIIFRHNTTIHPNVDSLPQATTLVVTGIYKFTRNPIYLGMAVALVAWTIFLENWLSISGVIVFIGFITRYQIIPEENALERIFGDEYLRYKKRVRRWI